MRLPRRLACQYLDAKATPAYAYGSTPTGFSILHSQLASNTQISRDRTGSLSLQYCRTHDPSSSQVASSAPTVLTIDDGSSAAVAPKTTASPSACRLCSSTRDSSSTSVPGIERAGCQPCHPLARLHQKPPLAPGRIDRRRLGPK